MSDLGVANNHHVIVYDRHDNGIFSAPRLWWTLRVFGHDNGLFVNLLRLSLEIIKEHNL
jgi:thiosulfate/3-mercaptopyruvate sulfurtransferase